ncbi:hypothetical protein HDU84_008703 [Entophlyctis sp. JEL0112]|nr:hypothetical protein HDU84_008703 [Entophlyctis sp. JEL0112]
MAKSKKHSLANTLRRSSAAPAAPVRATTKKVPNSKLPTGKSPRHKPPPGQSSHADNRAAALACAARTRPPAQMFSPDSAVLLIGDGNFSFANALLTTVFLENPDHITATSYDSAEIVRTKYPDAAENIENLVESGCCVLHGVDGGDISKTRVLRSRMFDCIVFNFPHIGAGIKDTQRNILANQEMLSRFFASAEKHLNARGEIHVTLKDSPPYTLWNIKQLAAASASLSLRRKVPFTPEVSYPGYAHRRTIGFDDEKSSDANADLRRGPGVPDADVVWNCFTFVFWRTADARGEAGRRKRKRGNGDAGGEEEDDSD